MDDILVKHKVISDDNYKIVASHDGTRVYVDKENPRVEIDIRKLEKGK
jgi:Holliday junction resolvase RusA-like endonuclease